MVREPGESSGRRWSIVLASHDGLGMQSAIRPGLERRVPKEYGRFLGSRSKFQHALDRTMQVTSPTRTVVIVDRGHHEAWAQIGARDPGMVLVQPRHLGTASEVFLSLTYIRARDPEGTVLISPSDHILLPEERFLREVLYAVRAAEQLTTKLVLLASRPEGPQAEYGWILPDHQLLRFGSRTIRAVKTFIERPEPPLAQLAYASGALWNTGIMAGKVEAFWNVGRKVLPNVMALFERLTEAIDTRKEAEVLRTMYERMPCLSFSRDLLEHAPGETAMMEMSGLWWSDWGKIRTDSPGVESVVPW
ncbi:sugar phosphate nucleotidyltransferase [Nitrospira defluvii]|uniref:NTP_transferase domain-containing protein n=1 Tax=Nitrospira defluvii TaxID=330214 RepID=A0ABM8RMD1_9BACT|nr:sugar phosphate nucleotidyltransferase [Nitrospira defluvii]CAE6760996.1 NTP_transferase domain-containing protein [Nitrospira defluvii]